MDVIEDEFDKVFSVNVKSIFHATRHFIPNLINQNEGGTMINIASIGATRPRPGLVWYNASKAAVANVCPCQQLKTDFLNAICRRRKAWQQNTERSKSESTPFALF